MSKVVKGLNASVFSFHHQYLAEKRKYIKEVGTAKKVKISSQERPSLVDYLRSWAGPPTSFCCSWVCLCESEKKIMMIKKMEREARWNKDGTSVIALSSSCTSHHKFFLFSHHMGTKPSDKMEINWPFLNHFRTKSAGLLSELNLKREAQYWHGESIRRLLLNPWLLWEAADATTYPWDSQFYKTSMIN